MADNAEERLTPEQQRTARRGGALLVFASVTFWISWFLMPDAGTNDAAHILEVVREHRSSVFASVIVQIVSSIAFAPATLLIVQLPFSSSRGRILAGATLLLIGAMGMCADAIFHLAAYYMTADGVAPDAVLRPMQLLQTEGIRVLVPLLLPFFIGAIVLALGLQRAGYVSRAPVMVFATAIAVAISGGVAAGVIGAGRHAVVLLFLGLFAVGLTWIGSNLMTAKRDS
jgi:hypothetical protein